VPVKIEFVFIAESGVLERQCLLLCESIREFGGRYAGAEITVLQPRSERNISAGGRLRFDAMGVRVVEMPVVSPCPEYGHLLRADGWGSLSHR
jgi:hypothetical protein